MIKIWGRTDSSNVQKVLWCCAELGIDFERLDWGGKFGGNNDKAYREMNPNGLVPTLKDGDFILWESNSIMRYLNVKYGGGKASSRHAGRHGQRQPVDGLAVIGFQCDDCAAVLEPGPNSSRQTRSQSRRGGIGQDDQSLASSRRSLGEKPLSWRGGIFARRHSARGLGLPLV